MSTSYIDSFARKQVDSENSRMTKHVVLGVNKTRTGSDRIGSDRIGSDRINKTRTGSDCVRLTKPGPDPKRVGSPGISRQNSQVIPQSKMAEKEV